jgi:hypothetical protein
MTRLQHCNTALGRASRMAPVTENPRIAWGGKSLYGARVGILMLETRFPRVSGDMGNAETWPFPVL